MFVVELAFGEDQERLAARPAHRERLLHLHEEGILRLAGPFVDDRRCVTRSAQPLT